MTIKQLFGAAFTIYAAVILLVAFNIPKETMTTRETQALQNWRIPFRAPNVPADAFEAQSDSKGKATPKMAKKKWTLAGFFKGQFRRRLTTEAAITDSGIVLANNTGELVTLSLSGEPRWKFIPDPRSSRHQLFIFPLAKVILVASSNGKIYLFSKEGELLSTLRVERAISSPPILLAGTLVVAALDLKANESYISLIDIQNLKVKSLSERWPSAIRYLYPSTREGHVLGVSGNVAYDFDLEQKTRQTLFELSADQELVGFSGPSDHPLFSRLDSPELFERERVLTRRGNQVLTVSEDGNLNFWD